MSENIKGDKVDKDKVVGDKVFGDKVGGDYIHIVNQYRSGIDAISQERLEEAISRYLRWVGKQYGVLDLRGLKPREQGPALTLNDVYVSLAAELRMSGREKIGRNELEELVKRQVETVSMNRLLADNPRLVIVGGPGSGKTTFLRIIAAGLAQALRTGETADIKQYLGLKTPLPLPIFVSLSAYNRYRRQENVTGDPRKGILLAFISHSLIRQQAMLGLPTDFFEQLLLKGEHSILLLDGLDEVANERERLLVRRAVEQLADNESVGRVVITSRTRAYQGQATLLGPFKAADVQPMTSEQVKALTGRWCAAVYPDEVMADTEAERLLAAIESLERLRRERGEPPLVDTPLMVTIVAIVHYDQRRLPDQRAELYAKCVEVLLAEGNKPTTEATFELADWGGTLTEKRSWLAFLAYQMMSAGKETGREIEEGQLRAWLRPRLASRFGEEKADRRLERFVEAMRERGSILDERDGTYRFTHLTFQEFLAAFYLAETVREVGKIVRFLVDEERVGQAWWRETALLVVGYLGMNSEEAALDLLKGLSGVQLDGEAALAAAELAGAAYLELDSKDAKTRNAITRRIVALLSQPKLGLSPPLRGLAGNTLAHIGDPRPGVGVMLINGEEVPDIELCYVPPGPFWMGSPDDEPNARDNEKPLHQVDLDYGYWIGRYPITVGQFRTFLAQSDYGMRSSFEKPMLAESATWPARYVTWDDALAFCGWLTERARAAGWLSANTTITLPSEAEWEKAARGGLMVPKATAAVRLVDGLNESVGDLVPNPAPQRRYPMGETLQPHQANYKAAGIGSPSAVGVFPEDVGQYGIMDLAGNVNEWTRSNYETYPYQVEDGREDLKSRANKVIRGGSYYDGAENWPRCASRYRDLPDFDLADFGFRVCVVSPFPSGL